MRAIGTEIMTFGMGLPVLYLASADVFLGGLTPTSVVFVSGLSLVLIALGREMRARGAQSSKQSTDPARLGRGNPSGDAVDYDTHPSNVGSAEGLESRKILVDPTRRIA
jgi:hypothetical protein